MNNPAEDHVADAHVPSISVVLPVYNGEQYLAEAIDSILAQSFTDFELIMIDDGSTDGSLEIMQQYQKRDARIRLVARENRNLATTLNDLIGLARGKWIARMDQDDISLPFRFERQMAWLEKTGADICGSWVRFFGSWDHRVWKGYQTDQAIKMDMLFRSPFVHPSVMMRTDSVMRLQYDKKYEKAEDYNLWVQAAISGWKMSNIPEVLFLYRKHVSQISIKSAEIQKKLGEDIQRKYWDSLSEYYGLGSVGAEEILNLANAREKTDMSGVEDIFKKLLRQNVGEARRAIMDNAARLYSRSVPDCLGVGARWRRLNRLFGSGIAIGMSLRLWLICFFRIRHDGALHNALRRFIFR
ncbi:glycosyltransferase family 2 protein [Thiovibrio frasassiensis]|uniref:Glycosyltransferase n=1 Tax=Thiovibrio frasassiensis TaxID=2984131 RepID=A0A9X4MEE6_9BACT|nr:glycosyltransferase [Thiovibrio frasassiensis]MDG4476039.1 glycosyltransferase [Thiovibrio frasassiensis]